MDKNLESTTRGLIDGPNGYFHLVKVFLVQSIAWLKVEFMDVCSVLTSPVLVWVMIIGSPSGVYYEYVNISYVTMLASIVEKRAV